MTSARRRILMSGAPAPASRRPWIAGLLGVLCIVGCSASNGGDDAGGEAAGAASGTKTRPFAGTYDDGTVIIVDTAGYLTATRRRGNSAGACDFTFEGHVSERAEQGSVVAHRGGRDINGRLFRTSTGIRLELDRSVECGNGQVQTFSSTRTSEDVDAGALAFWGVKAPKAAIFEGAARPTSGFQRRIDACRSGSSCAAPNASQDQGVAILALGPAPWVKVSLGAITGWMSTKDLYARPGGTLGGSCADDGGCGRGETCTAPASTRDDAPGMCTVGGPQGLAAGEEGGPCDERTFGDTGCLSGLDCRGAGASGPGVCTRKHLPSGSSCNTNSDYEECAPGLVCWGESDMESGRCGPE